MSVMTQEVETAVVELEIVSCQTCDLLFVASERRQTCPSCGGEGTGPYLAFVLDETGLHEKARGSLESPPEDVPAAQEEPAAEPAPEEAPEETARVEAGENE